MAKNTGNNRIAIKWIRDKAKAAYEKKDTCGICGTKEDLELHHLSSLTLLLNKWARENHYDISTDDAVLQIRDEFIDTHKKEIYDEVYTLCNKHHQNLHSVFGKSPALTSAPNQLRWIEKQKAKYVDGYVEPERVRPEIAPFSEFYCEDAIQFSTI